eukprot:7175308-Prymnesium_polylepis.1
MQEANVHMKYPTEKRVRWFLTVRAMKACCNILRCARACRSRADPPFSWREGGRSDTTKRKWFPT